MCPLRVILIFLSATVAGFFLLRGLNADPADHFDADADAADGKGSPRAAVPLHSKLHTAGRVMYRLIEQQGLVALKPFFSPSNKVGSAVKTGFWTLVDMASGRYLWRTLVSQPAKSESEKAR